MSRVQYSRMQHEAPQLERLVLRWEVHTFGVRRKRIGQMAI